MTSIHLQALTLRRPQGFVLGPIDLEIRSGSATAVIGPSGSGKTTLLRCIAGLEVPSSGKITFDGELVSDTRTRVPAEARKIGYVFQSGALWPHMSAFRQLRFVAPGRSPDSLRELLASVGLADKCDRLPAQLSAGECKRLALARAIAGDPRVLLLDEPLHSVDVHLRDELGLLVRRAVRERGLTSVLVTHDRDEALAIADDLVVMREGFVVERGSTGSMLVDPCTSYAAAFVAGATCLPSRANGDGGVTTALGDFPSPGQGGEVDLVLLAGDVHEAPRGQGSAEAEVLRVETSTSGYAAVVELAGRSIRVTCAKPPPIGSMIGLRLSGKPRLLPSGSARSNPLRP